MLRIQTYIRICRGRHMSFNRQNRTQTLHINSS